MAGRSEAYKKGFNSKFCDNPYDIGTQEYNEFERGWSQKAKRYPNVVSDVYKNGFIKDSGTYFDESRLKTLQISSKYNAYAIAKGK